LLVPLICVDLRAGRGANVLAATEVATHVRS